MADLKNVRSDDFVSRYSNNLQFDNTALDLRIVFGQFEQRAAEQSIIRQHTAVTLSWAEAKLLAYFIHLNVLVHEAENGKVTIPAKLIPQPFQLPADTTETEAIAVMLVKVKELHDHLIASNT